jgi:hypothetical protein
MVAERTNGLRVTVEALNDAGERIGGPEVFTWQAGDLDKMSEPIRVIGRVTGIACLEALQKRLIVTPDG